MFTTRAPCEVCVCTLLCSHKLGGLLQLVEDSAHLGRTREKRCSSCGQKFVACLVLSGLLVRLDRAFGDGVVVAKTGWTLDSGDSCACGTSSYALSSKLGVGMGHACSTAYALPLIPGGACVCGTSRLLGTVGT